MAKIYLSSTYSDLKDFREEAYRALRKLGHDVIAMEDYTASDERPLDKCLADVDCCDVYVGLFAWRYGYIPPEQEKSITELEFRTAANGKKCLIFMLDDNTPWSPALIDKESDKIDALRAELKKDFMVDFFSNKDELASDIAIAVSKMLAADEKPVNENTFAANKLRTESAAVNTEGIKAILGILKPTIIVFLAIIVISVLAMISCIAIPPIRNSESFNLALLGLGGTSTFSIGCLMFVFNKFVQLSQKS